MKDITRKNIKSVQGGINLLSVCFGTRVTCTIKYICGRLFFIRSKHRRKKQLRDWISTSKVEANDAWKRRFICLINSTNDRIVDEMIEAFYKDNVCRLTTANICGGGQLTVVCTERNEKARIGAFLEHYRGIGIKHFLICDNDSTDGTLEYLKEQRDVTLFYTREQYNSQHKTAWNNRMMASCGDDMWYLVVDADEFAWAPELCEMDINQYVERLLAKQIFAVKAIMLELYPSGNLGEESESDFRDEYRFYDRDNEFYCYEASMNTIYGAFYARVFNSFWAKQCKTPLFYLTEKQFHIGSHHIYPLVEDIESDYGMVLKHYKFLPGDENKFKEAIKQNNYANGSKMPKAFIKIYEQEHISAYDEKYSVEWNDATVQEYLPFIKSVSRT